MAAKEIIGTGGIAALILFGCNQLAEAITMEIPPPLVDCPCGNIPLAAVACGEPATDGEPAGGKGTFELLPAEVEDFSSPVAQARRRVPGPQRSGAAAVGFGNGCGNCPGRAFARCPAYRERSRGTDGDYDLPGGAGVERRREFRDLARKKTPRQPPEKKPRNARQAPRGLRTDRVPGL